MISLKLKENKSYGLWVNSLSLHSSDSNGNHMKQYNNINEVTQNIIFNS